jgi:hypothetical protein
MCVASETPLGFGNVIDLHPKVAARRGNLGLS